MSIEIFINTQLRAYKWKEKRVKLNVVSQIQLMADINFLTRWHSYVVNVIVNFELLTCGWLLCFEQNMDEFFY